MPYFKGLENKMDHLRFWMDLAKEQGVDVSPVEAELNDYIDRIVEMIHSLSPEGDYPYAEPDGLEEIKALRPDGPRRMSLDLSGDELYDRIHGAWLGRSAGCVLGVPVEGRDRAFIAAWAKKLGQPYPLSEYWSDYIGISRLHYTEPIDAFIKGNIDHVGQDDDLVYAILGLLILEEYGLDFTTADVGQAWVKYLPMACTAEEIALKHLKAGQMSRDAMLADNPYAEWIGADIRSDAWGYAAPGMPELAAEFGYRDARISHTRNGIYGEMFFSAVISAVFAVKDVREALEVGLTEIPERSRMAETVTQTIEWADKDKDWDQTWRRIAEKYEGMDGAHTLNNAALTIAALLYADGDFERAISLAVMGGLDTDCTAATAGSIMGAIVGAKLLPAKWIEPFNDRITTYMIGLPELKISDLANRTFEIAKKCRGK